MKVPLLVRLRVFQKLNSPLAFLHRSLVSVVVERNLFTRDKFCALLSTSGVFARAYYKFPATPAKSEPYYMYSRYMTFVQIITNMAEDITHKGHHVVYFEGM